MSNSNGSFSWAVNKEETVNGWSATLTVGHQTFYLQPQESEEQAEWMAEQLLTALGRVVSQLFTNKQNNKMKQQLTAGQLIDQLQKGYYLTKYVGKPEGDTSTTESFIQVGCTNGEFKVWGTVTPLNTIGEVLQDIILSPSTWEVALPDHCKQANSPIVADSVEPDPTIIADEAWRMLPDACKELMGEKLERTWKESLVEDIKHAYAAR